jgi:hypothetical protein
VPARISFKPDHCWCGPAGGYASPAQPGGRLRAPVIALKQGGVESVSRKVRLSGRTQRAGHRRYLHPIIATCAAQGAGSS